MKIIIDADACPVLDITLEMARKRDISAIIVSDNAHFIVRKSVKTVTLLDKPSRREVDFTPDYCGTTIPDEFVVGYGLDYDHEGRNLRHIYQVVE